MGFLHVSTHVESYSGPQDVDPSIQTLWDPQRLHSKKYALHINVNTSAYGVCVCVYTHRTDIGKVVYLTGVIY